MLTLVEVRTDQGDLLSLPIADMSNGFVIEDIDGLDPVNATLVSTSFANVDGEQYQTARREKRNIVIKLSLQPDYSTMTVRQLRTSLYGYFMPKSEVFLRFYDDTDKPVNISGRVESFNSPQFVKDPEATISIICFDPDFIADDTTVVSGSSVATLTETPLVYVGTIETGFVMNLNIASNVSSLTIYNRAYDNTISSMEIDGTFVAGDILQINTISGQKGITLTRAGVVSSLLYALSPYSDWLQIFPGTNNIRVYSKGSAIPYTLEYQTRYGGL